MVAEVSGVPEETFAEVCRLVTESGNDTLDAYVEAFSTEHHTAGGMSRFLPYLSKLQPEFFCEVSPELAAERGLEHLGWATIVTARSAIEARVLVTSRMPPLAGGRRPTPSAPGSPARPGPSHELT